MILNIRGCNGSGKSTVAMGLLDGPPRLLLTPEGPLTAGVEVALIGPYPEGKTGGCDRLKTFDETRRLIRYARDRYRVVVFEGVIISTVFGSWATFCCEVPFVWAFLTTPYEVCLGRIRQRNGGVEFKESLVRGKWETMGRVKAKAAQAEFQVIELNWEAADAECKKLCGLDCGARSHTPAQTSRGADPMDQGPDPLQISFL